MRSSDARKLATASLMTLAQPSPYAENGEFLLEGLNLFTRQGESLLG
ncbi:hypothetical protein H6G76_29130 [Nostoc sp. FACHB-152]|nr:hypothetical protein [Nostoc sp. FACHB-152]MBD2451122.1 hypothetical protein [Nostoc sp. FACHB-152]